MNESSFQIDSVNLKDLPFDVFYEKYFKAEVPVIIKEVGGDLPLAEWSTEQLTDALKKSGSTRLAWFTGRQELSDQHGVPDLVSRCLAPELSWSQETSCRYWFRDKGAVTGWHYDGNLLYGFSLHLKGKKEWTMVSPETPLLSYPFYFITTPFSFRRPDPAKLVWAKFTVEAGDMLFVPPLWIHRAESLGDKNINVNWIGTKKHSFKKSKLFERETEILRFVRLTRAPGLIDSLGPRGIGKREKNYYNHFGGGGRPLVEQLIEGVPIRRALRRGASELRLALELKRRGLTRDRQSGQYLWETSCVTDATSRATLPSVR
jgi:hypothetical protein